LNGALKAKHYRDLLMLYFPTIIEMIGKKDQENSEASLGKEKRKS
jgi:hypothetical protein